MLDPGIIWAFCAVIFPVFLALPTFAAYIVRRPSRQLFRILIMCGSISIISLWISVIYTLTYTIILRRELIFSVSIIYNILIILIAFGISVVVYFLAKVFLDFLMLRLRDVTLDL